MKNIIFIAAPGAGKGTQSQMLQEKYGFDHVSTGDLIREEIANETEIGLKVKDLIRQGLLVNDDIIFDMLKNKLVQFKESKGIIIDGFPRTKEQALRFDELFGQSDNKIDYVIYIDIDQVEAMKRVLGRMTCSACGSIYNEYYDSIHEMGKCNACGGELKRRSDDNEESFNKRFHVYLDETYPLIDYYKKQNKLYTIQATNDKEEVFHAIEGIINGE